MLDRQEITISGSITQCGSYNILGTLDQKGRWVEVVLSVQIKKHSMVTKGLHIRPATRLLRTLRKRRAHIGRPLANNVIEGHLILHHLLNARCLVDVVQGIMRPRMRRDLMTFRNHAFDQARVWVCGIDGTFPIVIARHEECCSETVLLQNIQELGSVDVWTVVVGKCHHIWFYAIIYVIRIGKRSESRARGINS